MAARLLLATILTALSASSASAVGSISMTDVVYADSVVVDVTVKDDGAVPACGWLAVTRGGTDVFRIERNPGGTETHRFVDTGIEPNTLYCYGIALRQAPVGLLPCQFGSLCDAFDCFCQIEVCVNTGPDPALLGDGYLSSTFPDGSPVDGNEVRAVLLPCVPNEPFIVLHIIPSTAEQYVDSGTAVRVGGAPWCCWSQCVWLLEAQAVTPRACIIAVEPTTWSAVKRTYRD